MKKVLILMVMFCLFTNVYAEECGYVDFKNFDYSIEYMSNYVDIDGELQSGYYKFTSTLSSEYYAKIYNSYGEKYLYPNNSVYLYNGVYKIDIYSNQCDSAIKSLEIYIPHYDTNCGYDDICEKDKWFDGTYEQSDINEQEKNNIIHNIISTRLIIVASSLILIIVIFFIFIKIRRRRKL